jgi:hypothetical protein
MMNESNFDVLYSVGKGTVVPILTLLDLIREAMAELGFILVFMVESFDSVMRSAALILLRAPLGVCELA